MSKIVDIDTKKPMIRCSLDVYRQAKRRGPEYIVTLTAEEQQDHRVQRLMALCTLPTYLQPWTLEYQVAYFISAFSLSYYLGKEFTDIPQLYSASERLMERGWSLEQIKNAFQFLCEVMPTTMHKIELIQYTIEAATNMRGTASKPN